MENNPFAPPKAAVLEAASEDGDLILEGRKVAAGRGTAWFREAWELFKRSPGLWIVLFVLFMVMTVVLAVIPGGSIVSYLLYATFMAGIMIGFRDVEAGRPLTVGHLFAGFKQNVGNLILVGLLYMVGLIVVTIVAFVPIGILMAFVIPGLGQGADAADFSRLAWTMGPIFLLAFLMILALSLPLIMAIWFAPALVVFHDVAPMASMKASFSGCLKNIVPFLVYGIVGLALMLLALIPLGLGLLVFAPVVWGTMYTAYQDIYLQKSGSG